MIVGPATLLVSAFVLLLAALWWLHVGRHLTLCGDDAPIHAAERRRRAFNRVVENAAAEAPVYAVPPSYVRALQGRARRHHAECALLLTALRDAGDRGLSIPEIYELGVENPRGRLFQLRTRGHLIEPYRTVIPERLVLVHDAEQEAA